MDTPQPACEHTKGLPGRASESGRGNRMRRILHVLGELERGGISVWLMTVLRHIDRERYRMDFFVHTGRHCAYDDEARSLGTRLINCPDWKAPLAYSRRFARALKDYGPYDVVHAHPHYFSGINLMVAAWQGVPVRIAHSHHWEVRRSEQNESPFKRLYYCGMARLIDRYATVGLAASRPAAEDLFGDAWRSDPRHRLLFCGIDLAPFHTSYDCAEARAELGIADGMRTIAHVGRFIYQKNHAFVLRVFAEVLKRDTRQILLLIGDGPLEEKARRIACELGVERNVRFVGSRSDVPRLLMTCADVFLFPSLYEGLGLALVEAQAAGLPCVTSDVPDESVVIDALVRRISLKQPLEMWVEEIFRAYDRRGMVGQPGALKRVEGGRFNILNSIGEIQSIYSGNARERGRL